MMLPNQITMQTFSQNGKGGYKAIEVDAFLQRVFQSYNKLYNDNKALCEKLDDTLPVLEEYNKRKNSIADALIWAKSTAEKNIEEAQSIADKLVSEATEKADKLTEEKIAEADAYYKEKTTEADKRAAKAQAEFDSIKKQSESYSEKYIDEINAKAKQLIDDANLKAASIVADAYADAKSAKEKTDAVISEANKELNAIKAQAAKIKNEMLALISQAQKAAEKVENRIFDPIEADDAEKENITADSIDVNEIEKFTLDGIEPEIEEIPSDDGNISLAGDEPVRLDFPRFFGTELPDVEELLSGIFTAVSEEKAKNNDAEEENSFRFMDIFADPADRGDTVKFNPIIKDSE